MLIIRRLPALLLLGLTMLSVQPAWAHRFGVVLLVPLSGQQADSGKAFVDGFALATGEQDAHAFEESDGHLGGLDSYLYPLDNRLAADKLETQLKRLMTSEKPAFLSAMAVPETTQALIDVARKRGIVVVRPEQGESLNTPDKITMVDGTPFSETFQATYRYTADTAASQGYAAARLISSAVRSLDQNPAQNPEATRDAIRQAQNRTSE